MVNDKIVRYFEEIGDLLEILGENVFRVRAYRRATEVIRGLPDLEAMHQKNDGAIEQIPGIGKDLHQKIVEIIETGECEMHARLAAQFPPGILEILRVRGIGPKKVKLFWEQLDISSIEQLRSAAESGALATLPGMGEKSQTSILQSLNELSYSKERIPRDAALKAADEFIQYLKTFPEVEQIQYAGSLRRKQATVGDIDILSTGSDVPKMMEIFTTYPKVRQILAKGETKSSVVLEGNLQVDFRVVEPESFGAALFYFTGPKQFNILVRTMALKRGLKINEYGLYEGEEKLAGKTEEEMFAGLDIAYLKPEEREHYQP